MSFSGHVKALRNAAGVLVVPLLELLFFRLLLHFVMRLTIGWNGILTDYDLLLPAPISSLCLFYLLQRNETLSLAFQKKTAAVHGLALLSFGALSFFYPEWNEKWGNVFQVAWWLVLSVMVFSGFFLFVPLRFVFANRNRFVVVPCLFAAFSMAIYQHSSEILWTLLRSPLWHSVRGVLTFFLGNQVESFLVIPHNSLFLRHHVVHVLIGKGCTGIDSLFLYLSTFLIFYGFQRKFFETKIWALMFAMGILWTFILNVLRISFLFLIGVVLHKVLPRDTATPLFYGFFHVHLGWVLSFFGMIVYFGSWMITDTKFHLRRLLPQKPPLFPQHNET